MVMLNRTIRGMSLQAIARESESIGIDTIRNAGAFGRLEVLAKLPHTHVQNYSAPILTQRQQSQQSLCLMFPLLPRCRAAITPRQIEKGRQMKKTATLLAGVIVPLVAVMSMATSSNAQSKTSDQAYCEQLVKEYSHGGIERGFAPESLEVSVAISQCRDGNPQPAIPVLERELRRNDFTLPRRT